MAVAREAKGAIQCVAVAREAKGAMQCVAVARAVLRHASWLVQVQVCMVVPL